MLDDDDSDSTPKDTEPGANEARAGDVEVPRFALGYPDAPELRALVIAFEQGRYDVVRERAPKLAEETGDPAVAQAARELRSRLDADPLAIKLLVGVLVLLVLLTAWAYLHHH